MDSKINEEQETCHGEINLLGTSLTTAERDISDGAYIGKFSKVGAGIYTNYYFKGYDYYLVELSNLRRPSGGKMAFWLRDMTAGTLSSEIQSDFLDGDSDGYCGKGFNNLDASHKYCVWLRVTGGSADLSGTIKVSIA